MKNKIFFEIFVGEPVEIVTSLEVPSQFKMSEDGELTEIKLPMTVQGYIMDMDDDFIYLSSDGSNANQAVPVLDVKHIQIVSEQDEVEAIIDDIPDPEDGSHFN